MLTCRHHADLATLAAPVTCSIRRDLIQAAPWLARVASFPDYDLPNGRTPLDNEIIQVIAHAHDIPIDRVDHIGWLTWCNYQRSLNM